MAKRVKAVHKVHMQHLHIDFEDGTMTVISRNDAVGAMPEVGKVWPPENETHASEASLPRSQAPQGGGEAVAVSEEAE